MKDFWKRTGAVVTGLIVIGSVITGVWAAEDRYAARDDVVLVELRLDKKILRDDRRQYEQMLFKIQNEYGINCAQCPPVVRDQYQRLQEELRIIREELEALKDRR